VTPAPEAQLLAPRAATVGQKLPRALAESVFWLGECFVWPEPDGTVTHVYNSAYLVHGSSRSLLVDTGHPNDWSVVERQLDELLDAGVPPVEWIFPTHAEVTHSGNLDRWLTKFPRARACGDMRDQHMLVSQHVDRFVHMQVGESVDLGDTRLVFVDAVFRDLEATLWAYDERSQVLFTGDGLGFGHLHGSDDCGLYAEETPDLPIPDMTELFAEYALYWTRLKSVEPCIERLDRLIEIDYPVAIIAPAHGAPVTDPELTMPRVRQGLRQVAAKLI
jgi:flavorubredoxin